MRKYYPRSSTTACIQSKAYSQMSRQSIREQYQADKSSHTTPTYLQTQQLGILYIQLGKYVQCTYRILWGGLLLLCLSLVACQSETLEIATLSISPNEELILPASGANSSIVVSTNQKNWTALNSNSWLKLRQAGNHLLVEADENLQVEERVAQIIIIAGSKQLQLPVRQKVNAQNAIRLAPEKELLTDRLAKELRIIVKTNSNKWRVRLETEDNTWLHILPRPRYGEIILSFDENKSRNIRQANLIVEDGKAKSELLIKQQGIPHFFLPYLKWESNLEEAEAFELQRNSRITLRPRPGDPVQGIRAVPYFQFSTISSAFQQVRYEYLNMGPRFLYKATLVAQDLGITKGEELLTFLDEEGYKLRTDLKSNEQNKFYINPNKKIHLQYTIDYDAREAYLIFTPLVEQTVSYTVPTELPLGFPIKANSTKTEVESWEKQTNSEYASGISQALGLPAYFALDPYFLRYYLYKENDANALQAVFLTLDPKYQGLYRYGGLLFVGREFDALLLRQGFVYDAYDQRGGVYYYINEQKNLRLAVSLMRIANLELTRMQVTLLK